MDLDRYIARNHAGWARLEELSGRARMGISRLGPSEVDELVQLYQRVSAQLSYVRTYVRDPTLVNRLTRIVAGANGVIYGKRVKSVRTVARFFTHTFPGAVYHCRRAVVVAACVFFVPAILLGVWLSNDQAALDRSAPRKQRQIYVEEQFSQYYSDQPSPVFFAEVTTNNIYVSFLAFALGGVSGGLGALYLLALNGAPVGIIGAWMANEGDFWRFLGYILPHGALELSAIVIAGGAGIRAGWSFIAPGDRTRSEAMRDEGTRAVTIVIGLMVMFVTAGLIEGFVTGSGLPTGLRVGLGVVLWVCYLAYFVVQGRAAAARGITGLLVEPPRSWEDEPDRWLPAGAVVDVPGRLA